MTNAKPKGRYFAFILYPESLPNDWQMSLSLLDVPMVISPLHDKDERELKESELNADELQALNRGEKLYKKPHYHVMYIAKNPVTIDGVRNKIKRCLGNKTISHVEIVDGVKSYYDYLTHESKDAIAKNKHIYNSEDLVFINDFDIDRYITLDESQKNEILNIILGLIYKYKFENMFDFLDFYYENRDAYNLPGEEKMNSIIKANSGLLRLYFDGAYQRRSKIEKQ